MLGPAAILLTLLACAVVAELALRFFPVYRGLYFQDVRNASDLFRAQPNRSVPFSRDWNFNLANTRRVNDLGFVNDEDYAEDGDRPLVAVVGDSYIEAMMVPYGETVYGRLAERHGDLLDVRSYGFSGAPLSQYLSWIGFATREQGADYLLINVVGNDFHESLARYKRGPGFWHYQERDGELKLELVPFERSTLSKLLGWSYLVNYSLYHLRAPQTLSGLVARLSRPSAPSGKAPRFVGNTERRVDDRRTALSIRAIEAFFRDLPGYAGLPVERIVFVVDAIRAQIYGDLSADEAAASYFGQMRRAFMKRAVALGYGVVDLQEKFESAFARDGRRFEYPMDGHWNGYAHGLVAEAIEQSPRWPTAFRPRDGAGPSPR